MRPIDFRNETFLSLQPRLSGLHHRVLIAWLKFGPCTTAQAADQAWMSILTFRPRTTELIQLGAVCLAEDQPNPKEGIYRARTVAEWMGWCEQQSQAATSRQQQLI